MSKKKKMKKYIATAAATSVLVAPMAVTPVEAATNTAVTVTNEINALAGQAKAHADFYSAVSLARTNYGDLSANQKSKVTAATVTKLVNAENAVKVMNSIVALNSNDLDVATKAASARASYSALPFAGKALVKNLSVLTAIEVEIKDKQAAAVVTNQIAALGATPTPAAVTAARTAFGKLTPAQQGFVDEQPLKDAENYISELNGKILDASNKVGQFSSKVAAIPTALTRTAGIEAAEVFLLNAEEITLLSAEKKTEWAKANTTYLNYVAAQEVIDDIAALAPLLETSFSDFATAVSNARKAYAALPFAQKALVTNLSELTAQEQRVAQGETIVNPHAAAIKEVEGLITPLPATKADVTINDIAAIKAAVDKYNALEVTAQAGVNPSLRTKLSDLITAPVYVNATEITTFENEIELLKTRTPGTIEAAIAAVITKYGKLSEAAQDEVDAIGNYANVLLAKTMVEDIKTAVAGVPANNVLTVEDSALTLLQTRAATYNGLDEDIAVYVKNGSTLTQKMTDTTATLKSNVVSAITAIPTAENSSVSTLENKITAADAALTKYALIFGVAATDSAVTSTISTELADLALAKTALPVVKQVAAINYVHPTTSPVDVTALTATINAYKALASDLATVATNKYFVNKSKLTTVVQPSIEASLTALATAADTAISSIETTSNKTEAGLIAAIATANAAVGVYDTANKLYKGLTASDYTAITKYGNIAIAEAAKPVVKAIDELKNFETDATGALASNKTARDAYTTFMEDYEDNAQQAHKFVINYDKLITNEGKVSGNLTAVKGTTNAAIRALLGQTDKAALVQKIADAKTQVGLYKTAYEAVYGTQTDETVIYNTLLNYGDIALADSAVATNGVIDKVAALVDPFTVAQMTAYIEAKGAIAALNGNYNFVVNKALYDTVTGQVNTAITDAKEAANDAIEGLEAVAVDTQGKLQDAIDAADDAVDAYTALYAPLNENDVAAAKATLENVENIVLAQGVHDTIVTKVATEITTPYTNPATAADIVPADLEAAITAYNAVKQDVADLNGDYKFFANKADFDNLETQIGNSITALKATAEGAIDDLEDFAVVTNAAKLEAAITDAETAVNAFTDMYTELHGVSVPEAVLQVDAATLALATAAQPVLERIETFEYDYIAGDDVVLDDLISAVIEYEALRHSVAPLEGNKFYEELGGNFEAVKGNIDNAILELKTKANTALDVIDQATDLNSLTTKIQEAKDATTDYLEVYVIYHTTLEKTDAELRTEGEETLTGYGNIAAAEKAKPAVKAVDELTYNYTTGAVDTAVLGKAIEDYHAALTIAATLTTDTEKAMFVNKGKISTTNDVDGTVLAALKAAISQLVTDATTAINGLAGATSAAQLNTLILEAEQAVTKYEVAETAFTKTAADLERISNIADIANATAAMAVGATIELALATADLPSTLEEHERLVKLLAAETAYEAYTDTLETAQTDFVFNSEALTNAISELEEPFAERVELLREANEAVTDLQGIVDATEIDILVNAAKNARTAYINKTIPNTAAPKETDVVGQADIELYELAAPTIKAVAAATAAVIADKAAAILTVENLYKDLAENVKLKVFNYTSLDTAKDAVEEATAQTSANAKSDAETAIRDISLKDNLSDYNTQIQTAESKVSAYTALSENNSIIDITNIDDLEYAKEAVTVITAIADLPEAATPETIDSLKSQLAALSSEAQGYVFNKNKLTGLEDKQNAAVQGNVVELVTGLGAIDADNLEESIASALEAYNTLTLEQQAAIADQKILTKIQNYQVAAPVITDVADMDYTTWTAATLTPEQVTALEGEIQAIRANYSSLAFAQKALVKNYANLAEAEAKLAEIKTAHVKAADQQIATVVINQIAALAQMDIDSPEYETAVTAARSAYKALAFKHKVLVTNLADLVSHEQNI